MPTVQQPTLVWWLRFKHYIAWFWVLGTGLCVCYCSSSGTLFWCREDCNVHTTGSLDDVRLLQFGSCTLLCNTQLNLAFKLINLWYKLQCTGGCGWCQQRSMIIDSSLWGTKPSLFQVRLNVRNVQTSPLDTTLHLYLEACTSVIHISECGKCVGPKGSLTWDCVFEYSKSHCKWVRMVC
jgi:hypothetical protein